MDILIALGVFFMDLMSVILSPEYGAEAIKVAAVYFMFRKDIKELGKKLTTYIESNDKRMNEGETKFTQVNETLQEHGENLKLINKHLGITTKETQNVTSN